MTEGQTMRLAWILVGAGAAAQALHFVPGAWAASPPLLVAGHFVALKARRHAPLRTPAFYGMLLAFVIPVVGPVTAAARLATLAPKGAPGDPRARARAGLVAAGAVLVSTVLVLGLALKTFSDSRRRRQDLEVVVALREAGAALVKWREDQETFPVDLALAGVALAPPIEATYRATGADGCELLASHPGGADEFRLVVRPDRADLFRRERGGRGAAWQPR